MAHDRYIVEEGYPFILISLAVTCLMWWSGLFGLALFFTLITIFIIAFFRNPPREIPPEERAIVAPADGKVIKIVELAGEGLITGNYRMISIFMNVFNVHVNRIPISGKIAAIDYRAGKFFSADLDKASALNERNYIVISPDQGKDLMIVQIAGLIARRIVCWVGVGAAVKKGERFGLIRFGSRLDVYLPSDVEILVRLGQKVRAGETILGVQP